MKVIYSSQLSPSESELHSFFEGVFTEIADSGNFLEEQNQNLLSDWFSVAEMNNYLAHGSLIEARLEDGKLIGAIFIGKQNQVSWPDGRKMEIFILGVDENYREQGVAKKLVLAAEEYAAAQKAQKIIVNTHVAMESVHLFYQKIGYEKMGILRDYYDNGDAVFFQKRV